MLCRGLQRSAAHSICYLKYIVPKKIPIVFHNGSNYCYDFIIKEFAEEFGKQFIYLGEDNEKYTAFSVPVQNKVTKIGKIREEIIKTISYRL